jgi:hypothetical protein
VSSVTPSSSSSSFPLAPCRTHTHAHTRTRTNYRLCRAIASLCKERCPCWCRTRISSLRVRCFCVLSVAPWEFFRQAPQYNSLCSLGFPL